LVGAGNGTTGMEVAEAMAPEYGFSTQAGEIAVMSESLKSGAMQAIITEQCVADSYIAANPGKFQMIAEDLTVEEIKAITNMNNDKLQAKVDEIIKAFVDSEAYSELVVKWFD
ncbi:MAG: transporter substrate-binding domain-containing protein, partial [Firmicutes bacterium]|nr:transporter substrate-binding domain-containing protein [Bacillota bacterium]